MPPPRVWIIPYTDIDPFLRDYPGGRRNVSRSAVLNKGADYENAWYLIDTPTRR